MSAVAFASFAHEPNGPGALERNTTAAATIRLPGGWKGGLGVSYFGKREGVADPASLRASTLVGAHLTRSLSKQTSLSFDVFNLFDQRLREVDYFSVSRLSGAAGASDAYLFNPAESRGIRLRLKMTF